MKLLQILLPFLCVFLLPYAACAQQSTAKIRGVVTRGQRPAALQNVRYLRLTNSAGVIDSTQNPDRGSTLTDSLGRYEIVVNPAPAGVRTIYALKVANCDSTWVVQQVEVRAAITLAQPILLCVNPPPPSCTLDPVFAPHVNGLTVFALPLKPTAGTRHTWRWGDASPPDTAAQSGHTYANAGRYTITHLEFASPTCFRQFSITVSVGGIVPTEVVGAGQVFAGARCVSGLVRVHFIPVDTARRSRGFLRDSTCRYVSKLAPGRYLVRAIPISPELIKAGYMPTYFGGLCRWDSSAVVDLTNNRFDLDIHLRRRDTSRHRRGQGRLRVRISGQGTVVSAAMPGATPRTLELEDTPIYLYDQAGSELDYAFQHNGASEVVFNNMEAGTYRLAPDAGLVASTEEFVSFSATTTEATIAYNATSAGIIASVTSIKAAKGAVALKAYPNPCASSFTLSLPAATGQAELTLMGAELMLIGADGRTIRTQTADGPTLTVSVQGLAPGLYHAILAQNGSLLGALRVQVVN